VEQVENSGDHEQEQHAGRERKKISEEVDEALRTVQLGSVAREAPAVDGTGRRLVDGLAMTPIGWPSC
jgi:hypothetical protein